VVLESLVHLSQYGLDLHELSVRQQPQPRDGQASALLGQVVRKHVAEVVALRGHSLDNSDRWKSFGVCIFCLAAQEIDT